LAAVVVAHRMVMTTLAKVWIADQQELVGLAAAAEGHLTLQPSPATRLHVLRIAVTTPAAAEAVTTPHLEPIRQIQQITTAKVAETLIRIVLSAHQVREPQLEAFQSSVRVELASMVSLRKLGLAAAAAAFA